MTGAAIRRSLIIAVTWLSAGLCRADGPVDYVKEIKPLLAHKCYACHGAVQQKAKLRLETRELMVKGGRHGAVIVPGAADKSLMVQHVLGIDEALMPPEGEGEKFNEAQVALLKRWINEGAKAPDEPTPADPRQHWAFQPPVRPAVPKGRHPIDAFLAEQYQKQGLTPEPAADRGLLLRRVYFDLIGLPPTVEELRAFLADSSPDAYEKVVDRLLASPRHAERWGRHWMDVWRYSDWSGENDNQVRGSPKFTYRWRDWIIESIHQDKGYDRMVLEMLAGDELAPADPNVLRATGFLARNFYRFNRNVWLDDTVEHTAKAFLGLTMNCAKCHDHKFDPIFQADYYKMRAFFEPYQVRTDRVAGQSDIAKDGLVRVFDRDLDKPTYVFHRGVETKPLKDQPQPPGLPTVLGGTLDLAPVKLPAEAFYPGLASILAKEGEFLAQLDKEIADAQAAADKSKTKAADLRLAVAQAKKASIVARLAADKAKFGYAPNDRLAELVKIASDADRMYNLLDGEERLQNAEKARAKKDDAKARKEVALAKDKLAAARKALTDPSPSYQPLGEAYLDVSSGRRLALARWIVDRKNPLTARVALNHLWLRHFGTPLNADVVDFGLRAPKPRHADLLDWLAVEFMDKGWSMKAMHKLLVTSQAYRMGSGGKNSAAANLARDPDNKYLWRQNPWRLEGEALRDGILSIAGNLDTTMGGPEIPFGEGETSHRRSVYFRHAHERTVKFIELFDGANPLECYRRSTTVVPQQALALANSTIGIEQSRVLARKLNTTAKDKGAFVDLAFEIILCRQPLTAERQRCMTFLEAQPGRLTQAKAEYFDGAASAVSPASDPQLRARENLVHVLFNHNDFATVR